MAYVPRTSWASQNRRAHDFQRMFIPRLFAGSSGITWDRICPRFIIYSKWTSGVRPAILKSDRLFG
jgi:hypothetical protein